MKEFWRCRSRLLAAFLVCCFYLLNLSFCWSLNDEGVALLRFKEKIVCDPHGALSSWIDEVGVESPCSWFGIECSEGYVVDLNLKDLRLRGTLAPDVLNLVRVKSIILRNNSFSGIIPEEIENLKELDVLDLEYNNFCGHLPRQLREKISNAILLLDNNELLGRKCPEVYKFQELSEVQLDEDLTSRATQVSSDSVVARWNSGQTRAVAWRKLLQEAPVRRMLERKSFVPVSNLSRAPSPSRSPPQPPSRSRPQHPSRSRPPPPYRPRPPSQPPSPSPSPVPLAPSSSHVNPIKTSRTDHRLILGAAIGGSLFLLTLVTGIFFCPSGKVATVRPWVTGLSGQLQKAFVTGVPKLKRSELDAACEDFSNVIGSSSVCTLYKGTLSSGVEIAVASVVVASTKDWSNVVEAGFRKKIDTLSKLNHKNFANLLGYCEEEEPFTRMMVFEYAPNGTLFEHLHIKEAEHLDWMMRLRIAMGIAYCLEHMHQLTPALAHKNLTSSSVYLTEDYAAKVSDFVFWDKGAASETQPNPQSNVYSFGVVLFEMITGKLPYSAGSDSLRDWASDYLRREQPLREMVDRTLKTYVEDQLQQIDVVIKSCVDPDPTQRPTMKEVCARLREITRIARDGAVPKLSPLWWAELEILSEAI